MARGIIKTENLPPYAAPYAARISLLGFGWHFVEEHRLASVSKRVQVRDSSAVAPSREVSRYALAIKRGDPLPPVIITRDGYLIDGATRTEAARKAGKKTFPAFVVDVNYEENLPEALRRQLILLGSAFNLTHGRGMNAANISRLIEQVADEDDSAADIAAKLHIGKSSVEAVLNAKKARSRADTLGVHLDGTLTTSHLRVLGGKSPRFTDPVFKEFIEFAQAAKLTIASMSALARRLEDAGTEGEKIAMINAERNSYRAIINGTASRPSRPARLRQTLGYLNRQNPEMLIELEPGAARDHRNTLEVASKRIQEVLAAQDRADQARREK